MINNNHWTLAISNFWAFENTKCCFMHGIPFSYPTSPCPLLDPDLQTLMDSHCVNILIHVAI